MRITWKLAGWVLVAVFLLALLAGGLAARHYWTQLLQQNGIETLSWQGMGLSFDGLVLEKLELRQSGPVGDVVVQVRELETGWSWPEQGWRPQWDRLKAGQLQVDWYPETLTQGPGDQPPQSASPPELPAWLPAAIDIQQFDATAPCGTDRCTLSGSLSLTSTLPRQPQPGITRELRVQARVPQPWPVPGVGQIQGDLEMKLTAKRGQWYPQRLQADLELSQPAAWAQAAPEYVRPESLTLAIRPAPALPSAAADSPVPERSDLLPLQVSLNGRGGADVVIESHLAVTTSAPWVIRLGETRLEAALPELTVAGWTLTQPQVRTTVTGWLDRSTASLTFDKPTNLDIARLIPANGHSSVRVEKLGVQLTRTKLHARYQQSPFVLDELALSGPLVVKARQVHHRHLRPQAWAFNGKLNSSLERSRITGLLRAGSGTTANLDMDLPYGGTLRLNGKMRVSGEDEANALSRIFSGWPPLLSISGGTVSADVSLRQAKAQSPHVSAKLAFVEWDGLYDRTAWKGMNGSVDILLRNEQFRIDTPELTIEQVNPGLPLGPLRLVGDYEAPLARPDSGTLTIERALAEVLGGEVEIQPGSWDLTEAPVTIPIELRKLSLARLLQLYPAEGLAGTGILSGTVPVLFDPATGVEIKRGRIDALKPGGRLQLTAERLKALASQSETMKTVTRALEDFRYSVLDSGINYDDDGTLVLTLHLRGRNPEVGNGQPVVLNVNLEENIPALLKSLQLSGNVSDRVKERVKKLLEKRQQNSDDP